MSLERPCIHWNDGYCKKFSDGEVKSWCVDGPCKYEQPSNADRIRAMSDEELAKCIYEIGFDCHLCSEHKRLSDNPFLRHEKCDEKCVDHCLEWLKQPAE